METTKREYRPYGWQLDANSIETNRVQLWSNGMMMTCRLTKKDAQEMVNKRQAFVICDQAIGSMINGISRA